MRTVRKRSASKKKSKSRVSWLNKLNISILLAGIIITVVALKQPYSLQGLAAGCTIPDRVYTECTNSSSYCATHGVPIGTTAKVSQYSACAAHPYLCVNVGTKCGSQPVAPVKTGTAPVTTATGCNTPTRVYTECTNSSSYCATHGVPIGTTAKVSQYNACAAHPYLCVNVGTKCGSQPAAPVKTGTAPVATANGCNTPTRVYNECTNSASYCATHGGVLNMWTQVSQYNNCPSHPWSCVATSTHCGNPLVGPGQVAVPAPKPVVATTNGCAVPARVYNECTTASSYCGTLQPLSINHITQVSQYNNCPSNPWGCVPSSTLCNVKTQPGPMAIEASVINPSLSGTSIPAYHGVLTATLVSPDGQNSSSTPAFTQDTALNYNATSKTFNNTVTLPNVAVGSYELYLHVNGFLGRRLMTTAQTTTFNVTSPTGTTFNTQLATLTPGDVTSDGVIDLLDYQVLHNCINGTTCTDSMYDLNGDGVVDQKDLDIVKANMGKTSELPGSMTYSCMTDPSCQSGLGNLQLCSLKCGR